jgi:hypothetical protein
MINLHSTQTKKSYHKPVLVKKGKISVLTRGGTGGSADNFQTQKLG